MPYQKQPHNLSVRQLLLPVVKAAEKGPPLALHKGLAWEWQKPDWYLGRIEAELQSEARSTLSTSCLVISCHLPKYPLVALLLLDYRASKNPPTFTEERSY